MQSAFTEVGVIAVREDIALEPAFWAQFPGNFKDIARRALISTANFAGFASGHNFPVGQPDGQPLGPGGHRAGDHLGRALLLQLPQGRPRQLHRHRAVRLGQDGGAELPAGPGRASSTRASSSSTRTAAPRSSCAPSAAATTCCAPASRPASTRCMLPDDRRQPPLPGGLDRAPGHQPGRAPVGRTSWRGSRRRSTPTSPRRRVPPPALFRRAVPRRPPPRRRRPRRAPGPVVGRGRAGLAVRQRRRTQLDLEAAPSAST